MSKKWKKNKKTIAPQQAPANDNSESKLRIPIITEPAPPPQHAEHANDYRHERTPLWKKLLEGGALLAGIGYAVVTYLQWQDIKHNFATDERAWVGIAGIKTEGGVQDFYTFKFENVVILFNNTGKTPARELTVSCCIPASREFTDRKIPDYDTETKRSEDAYKADQDRIEDEIKRASPPGDAEKIHQERLEWDRRWRESHQEYSGGILTPSASFGVSATGNMSWSWGRRDKDGRPMTLYFLGRITYRDIFPDTEIHTTKFCIMHLKGDFVLCPSSQLIN